MENVSGLFLLLSFIIEIPVLSANNEALIRRRATSTSPGALPMSTHKMCFKGEKRKLSIHYFLKILRKQPIQVCRKFHLQKLKIFR